MRETLNKALKWLNANAHKHPEWLDETFVFDYPDYAGLPRSINKLSCDEVDAIQNCWPRGVKKWDGRRFRTEVSRCSGIGE